MSADLDYLADGTAAMFSVGATPWHREGRILAQAPSLAEALAMAGQDFEVDTRQLYYLAADGSGEYVAVDHYATVRDDRPRKALGVVGRKYTPLQNADAFQVLEPLLDKGVAKLETGGTLGGGEDVWMLIRFNIDDPVVQECLRTEVVPFGLVTNNHSGKSAVTVTNTPIRVVCRNTLSASLSRGNRQLGGAISVRHTASVATRVTEAAEQLWIGIVERYRAVGEAYASLRESRLTRAEFDTLVLDEVVKVPTDPDKFKSKGYFEGAVRRAEEKRDAVQMRWTGGIGHRGDHSGWEAYNAVAEALDHDTDNFKVRGSRIAALRDGSLSRVKGRVFENLLAHAAS